ncbi:MAG: D-alanyl-D-alanine carboxypeptidase [candidate division Zixibacteria bacterium]|nr:D-alanyl-D-alanine carboxypeptidase [candidate division Zixibacteria bacterium]NIR65584.1 D-alanyl-D-alanine carboxypeptidase [candidate division Zixibacteria bacterium]NIS15658.1 D-alanyl-D-alanine carboxypeptidase [candidate division Zixibacteria bacterium]NIS47294.1 D-alanyl-D-alanine carboxypeptidase [candidate division Zixibacteria bacterium]NIT52166.1 D-alanyl-D-alanine carboxypeptidase [candidate division Zixibacteria bacterium]
MRKKVLVFLVICIIAYIGLGFMEGSGSVAVDYINTTSSMDTVSPLPPAEFAGTDMHLTGPPTLRCLSAIVVDNNTNQILFEKNSAVRRPVASITKLLAAIVLAEMDFDLNQKIIISRWDSRSSGSPRLKIGEKFFANDLFYAALIASDNQAIKALARTSGVAYPEFIRLMNQTAKKLGMDSTSVIDPSGIFDHNISSARDCAKLLNYAFKFLIIKSALSTRLYEFRSLNHKRLIRIGNTNRMLKSKWKISGGKTGYISASGYCLANRMQDDSGGDITTVILGAPSNSYRFSETAKMAEWAFKNLEKKLADGGK